MHKPPPSALRFPLQKLQVRGFVVRAVCRKFPRLVELHLPPFQVEHLNHHIWDV